jgi:hypothetical protein
LSFCELIMIGVYGFDFVFWSLIWLSVMRSWIDGEWNSFLGI